MSRLGTTIRLVITNCADIKRVDFHHTYLASLAEAISFLPFSDTPITFFTGTRVTGLIYVNDATVWLTVLEPTLMCKTSSPIYSEEKDSTTLRILLFLMPFFC
ncbi:hypothetical protein L1987_38289 [Smallanthus sonchifolius]|uniref:Uncharacterized protein n=1 Tax=Smallanthus sonchifolius TaxID=185202 RepID=A0ACB9HJY9_9ASTR|nr:hypothetical protein L1987_38289 [Smallanthus sonchifolius]